MSGNSDPMASAMDELLAVASLNDDAPGCPVDLLTTHTGTHRFNTSLLRKSYDLVHLENLRTRLPYANSPGDVRPVAKPQAAEIQDNRVPGPDQAIPCLVVRLRSIGTRSHDGEVDLLMSELSQ